MIALPGIAAVEVARQQCCEHLEELDCVLERTDAIAAGTANQCCVASDSSARRTARDTFESSPAPPIVPSEFPPRPELRLTVASETDDPVAPFANSTDRP
jgi:hypothetical protein